MVSRISVSILICMGPLTSMPRPYVAGRPRRACWQCSLAAFAGRSRSYGFRPGRSAHQMLQAIRNASVHMAGGWIVEVDIKKFFDTVAHSHLRNILCRRIRDRVLLRLIG